MAGPRQDAPSALPIPATRSVREVLEEVIGEELRRGPCFVSFSGGRDSSAVLATATLVARREGLDPPIPVSLRFPGVPSTEESAWQERVIAHLRLENWIRLDIGAELDLLGDISRRVLSTHGLLWPPNAYIHDPMFRVARGARLLTGLDGDGLFGGWPWAQPRSRASRRSPLRWMKDAVLAGAAASPTVCRQLVFRRRPLPPVTWLRPDAQRRFARLWVRESAAEPTRWDQRITWYAGRRYLHLARESLAAVASDHECIVAHPYTDERFLAVLARDGGRTGFGTRTETMRALFGDVLPEEVIARRGKAEFGRALWRDEARAFAAHWDGSGLDDSIVDGDELRKVWAMDNPWFASITPLHAAWLAQA